MKALNYTLNEWMEERGGTLFVIRTNASALNTGQSGEP